MLGFEIIIKHRGFFTALGADPSLRPLRTKITVADRAGLGVQRLPISPGRLPGPSISLSHLTSMPPPFQDQNAETSETRRQEVKGSSAVRCSL